VLGNLLAGYAYVDRLVTAGVDPFALGNLKHLLELNHLVLCGTSPERRAAYSRHLEANERRFYGEDVAGVRDVVEWIAGHPGAPSAELAAGVYTMMLAQPQLFIEGNHRTGVLAMSYVLARQGLPPFVLTPENAGPYFEISAALRDAAKHSPAMRFRLSSLVARLAGLLAEDADRRHLLA
jgi:prophage maintenance system killer protein